MLVNKRVKLWGFEEEVEVQVPKLDEYATYMIEVTYDKTNFIHRAIMTTDEYREDDILPVKIFCNDYDDIVFTTVDKLYYVKIIAELSMDVNASVVYEQKTPAVKTESATVEDFNDTQGPEIITDETPCMELEVASEDETPSVVVVTEEAPVIITETEDSYSEEPEMAPSVYEEDDQGLPLLEL